MMGHSITTVCWIAACSVVGAVWLLGFGRQRSPQEVLEYRQQETLPLTLLLEMVSVCVRQGASIPHALDRIGAVVGPDLGRLLQGSARLLNKGTDWYAAWAQACSDTRYGHSLEVMQDCLEPSWRHGISPLGRIETTIEQLDQDERRRLDQASAGLGVKILLPTGLCILPAFILIGVVPCIASFAGSLFAG